MYDYLLSGSSEKKKINIASNDKLSSIFTFNTNNKYVKHNNFEMIDEQIIEADKVFTLDNFCSANNINNIDFLKIDTQGAELEILKGIGCEVIELDCNLDYTFPRYNPNPEDMEMLHEIAKCVKQNNADVGFGFDGYEFALDKIMRGKDGS